MNKQVKILENKVKQIEEEAKSLQNACNIRLEILARNDGQYQNLQGQIMEKQKRLSDMREVLSMTEKNIHEQPKPGRPRTPKQINKEAEPGKDT